MQQKSNQKNNDINENDTKTKNPEIKQKEDSTPIISNEDQGQEK